MNNSQSINASTIQINDFHQLFKQQNTVGFKNSNNSELLVLNLADLSGELLNLLKSAQCKMLLLNENFKIVEQHKKATIQLSIEGKKQQVAFENIIRLEANGNYTYIHLKGFAKPVLTSKTLKHYVGKLAKVGFIRPHSKHLINVAYILQLKQNNLIELSDDTVIPVSRRRLKVVKKMLLQ